MYIATLVEGILMKIFYIGLCGFVLESLQNMKREVREQALGCNCRISAF